MSKRIALVSQEYPPETAKGGIGSQTFAKAHGLHSLGHQVHVISRAPSKNRNHSIDRGVNITRIPGMDARMPLYTSIADWVGYSTEIAATISAIHAESPLDLLDFPEWGCEGYVHLLNQTAWNRIPTVIHLHGPLVMFAHTMGWPEMESEFYRNGVVMESTCVRLANAVFSSSSCSADWCAKHYGIDRASIPILHTGVDISLFSPRNAPKEKNPTIIFAGKLAENKGAKLLLEAACNLARDFPDLRLRMLGRGEPKIVKELSEMVAARRVPDLLELAGFIDRAELPTELSRAHIFAAPSEYEGGPGFVYLEAMACGLPVIACSGSGAAEVIRQGENGLLVPPRDLPALEAALRTLLLEPARRQEMGKRGREFVLTEADSRNCIRKLEAFYLSVMKMNETSAGN